MTSQNKTKDEMMVLLSLENLCESTVTVLGSTGTKH